MAPPIAGQLRSQSEIAGNGHLRNASKLFLASFLTLYFELLVIRYISTELKVFVSLKNLPLIASFFGIGAGMLRTGNLRRLSRSFAWVAAALFLLARFRDYVPQPSLGWQYALEKDHFSRGWSLVIYISFVLAVLWLIVAFFAVLGDKVGEYLKQAPALPGYGVNLAGSLAGMLAFTLLSFLCTPPTLWLAIGFGLLVPFLWRQRSQLAVLGGVLLLTALPPSAAYWSPYHQIDIKPVYAGGPRPAGYALNYNHLWYQTMVDLSAAFMREHPGVEPNSSVRDYYELPYRVVAQPHNVLIVGAGTGNDVAAALRHGAQHVDAVEIDPVILELGRRFHPERPYASPRVTVYVDDARAFFHKTPQKYDLVIFGFLDSSTLLSSFSSLRLDNYVYTLEGLETARTLLTPNGSLVLAFAVTRGFAGERLFVTMKQAFAGIEPRVFVTRSNVWGMVFVEGAGGDYISSANIPEATGELRLSSQKALAATDNWPFLYLETKSVPPSLQLILGLFVITAWMWQRSNLRRHWDRRAAEFFLLGAGFLLLETNAVTRLALLFGSTWLVNAAVISAFLFMSLAANTLVERVKLNSQLCYIAALLLLVTGALLQYFGWAASLMAKNAWLTAFWTALPVFFSGLVFSSELRESPSAQQALAMNLLGAVVGGVLENAVMIGGNALVAALACIVYAGAWACSAGRKSPAYVVVPVAD